MLVPRLDHPGERRIGQLAALVWIAAVVVISLVSRARPGWVASLAASPDRVREGKLWFLVSSGMLVDHPVWISLVFFVALAMVVLLLCGVRTFWWTAFLGQVAATVLVYASIGAVRWFVPAAFESVVVSPDFGVSTISAAWLGASAAVGWRGRGQSVIGRFSIAVSCVAVGVFAYSVRPELGVLSSEHVVAFALGITGASLASWRAKLSSMWRAVRSRVSSRFPSRHQKRVWLAVLAGLPAALAIAFAPAGLAALRGEIVSRIHPTVTRCALEWNSLRRSPRTLIARRPAMLASLTITRVTIIKSFGAAARPPILVDYCRYVFVGRQGANVVLGMWRHGRVVSWTLTAEPRLEAARHGNASVDRDGRVHLHSRRGRGMMLSS
jgi:hypothetical protein